jgi:hypothetical protein
MAAPVVNDDGGKKNLIATAKMRGHEAMLTLPSWPRSGIRKLWPLNVKRPLFGLLGSASAASMLHNSTAAGAVHISEERKHHSTDMINQQRVLKLVGTSQAEYLLRCLGANASQADQGHGRLLASVSVRIKTCKMQNSFMSPTCMMSKL